MDPDTSPDTPQGFHLASDASGLTLHIPPLPNLAEIVLFLAALGFALFLLLRRRDLKWATIHKPWRGLTGFLQRNYVTTLILFGIVAIGWAVYNYLWQIPGLIGDMLHDLTEVLANDEADTEDIRNIGYTFAALAGMLAILATIPFQLVRVWINERTAATQEANLTTGLINTAVEGLGAEKKVSRIGRPVTFTKAGEPDHTEIDWRGEDPPSPPDETWKLEKRGDWQTFDQTQPNIEVRVGAILTLDRIARENPGEHIRVMDILCAYIRENAPARDAKDHDLGPWPDYPENPTAEDVYERRKLLDKRAKDLRNWIGKLTKPRTDIQTALTTIGNRDPERIEREEANHTRGGVTGYRLDLRETNLRKCDLSHLDLRKADLSEARMEGANLNKVSLDGANLRWSRMEGATLRGARLRSTKLIEARLEMANLQYAWLEGSNLQFARMERTSLFRTRLQRATLFSARLERANLDQVDMKSASLIAVRFQDATLNATSLCQANLKLARWAGATLAASVRDADLRGARSLTQAQLDQMIGNEMTLLRDGLAPDTNQPYSIPSCWKEPPAAFVAAMERRGYNWEEDPEGFLCPPGQEPARTGTPLALDAPYPEGHPLAERHKPK